ncbi:hypothetical protein SCUCBS95973_003704 [Sporothrix curviconia]|uniref:Uncharacterized protein n=1 Tax=Sporothrix curviconia TaxID=1260050 RepID=A0ABP0BHP3_9PEZI
MARTRPIRIGQWIHNGLHLALVALAVALISGTAYALAVGGKDALGTLIAGALISLLDDIGIILLYNAQSSLLAVTIVADIFAIALCAVGVIVVALSGLGRGDDPNPQPQEHRKSDDAEYIALSLSLTLL